MPGSGLDTTRRARRRSQSRARIGGAIAVSVLLHAAVLARTQGPLPHAAPARTVVLTPLSAATWQANRRTAPTQTAPVRAGTVDRNQPSVRSPPPAPPPVAAARPERVPQGQVVDLAP